MLVDNKDLFVKYIPSVDGYEIDIDDNNVSEFFQTITPYLQESEREIINDLIGNDLYNIVKEHPTLKDHLCLLISCKAYYRAIPSLDLVHTPSGFAVVNTTNQAPASKERVERLLQWLNVRISDAIDQLILLLLGNKIFRAEWAKSENFKYYTECLFLTASSYRRYINKKALREDLDENHSLILSYQSEISKMISKEYLDELIEKRRSGDLTEKDNQMITLIYPIIGLLIKGFASQAYWAQEDLVNAMVRNLDQYPTYEDSEAYRIKMSAKYRNKKEDSTFFF